MTAADQTPATERGLEGRYSVERLSDKAGKHDACRYFVLDPRHDPLAVEALRTYSRAARPEHPALADDLDAWVGLTPATDSERVEALDRARRFTASMRAGGACDGVEDHLIALDDEVTRLTALLAEQAATIERVRAVHKADRGMPNACCECGTRFPCETITALGSQRTEGQG